MFEKMDRTDWLVGKRGYLARFSKMAEAKQKSVENVEEVVFRSFWKEGFWFTAEGANGVSFCPWTDVIEIFVPEKQQ